MGNRFCWKYEQNIMKKIKVKNKNQKRIYKLKNSSNRFHEKAEIYYLQEEQEKIIKIRENIT